MIWLAVPVVILILTLVVLDILRSGPKDFPEVHQRDRALKALGKHYDPSRDVVLKRQAGADG